MSKLKIQRVKTRAQQFVVRGKLLLFPMEAAWTYLPISLNKVPKVPRGGWGSVPVMATVGKTTWRTSLFPMRKDDYFIPIKRAVCKAEGLVVGGTITVRYQVAVSNIKVKNPNGKRKK